VLANDDADRAVRYLRFMDVVRAAVQERACHEICDTRYEARNERYAGRNAPHSRYLSDLRGEAQGHVGSGADATLSGAQAGKLKDRCLRATIGEK
jgi:hypothetical protein